MISILISIYSTHFGTTTRIVARYSESKTKSSFFTISTRFLVNKLPLEKKIYIYTTELSKIHQYLSTNKLRIFPHYLYWLIGQ